MKTNDLEIKILDGSDIIAEGHKIDAFKQPIIITAKYKVRINHKRKSLTILKEEDWTLVENVKEFDAIKREGGLNSWANFRTRLGFLEDPKDSISYVEELIEYFASIEHFERASYLKSELEKLKN
jgi:hypothetical protein